MATYAQLIDEFGDGLRTQEKELIEELRTMCTQLNINAVQLKAQWESFLLSKHKAIVDINLVGARELRATLARKIDVAVQSKARTGPINLFGPSRPAPTAGTSSSAAAISGFMPVPQVSERRYRYMQERVLDRGEALDDRIDEFEQLIRDTYPQDGDIADPSSLSQDDVLVVGRICLDRATEDESDAKLNEASLQLEPSRDTGTGYRIGLSFAHDVVHRDGRSNAVFFPGAIVALKGRPGKKFTVREVLRLPEMKREEMNPNADATVCVAAGPFTFDTNFKFEPMMSLLRQVQERKPDALILLGPFIDTEHPLIKTGDIDDHPRTIFQREVLGRLKMLRDRSPGTTIYLVPSIRDAVADHVVFPQGELPNEWTLPSGVHMQPNPAIVDVRGVKIGASSLDVIAHIKAQEYTKGMRGNPSAGTATLEDTCRHVIEQRSFYPLFPGHPDANLDVTHSHLARLEAPLDALILPSKLTKFNKDVDGCAVVNPAYVARGSSIGQFATLIWRQGQVEVEHVKLG